jgi:hypothetical protein
MVRVDRFMALKAFFACSLAISAKHEAPEFHVVEALLLLIDKKHQNQGDIIIKFIIFMLHKH